MPSRTDVQANDSSNPSVRDGMRTAVGQARLLMKERFSQFEGLVDDCALGRGERVTTCSDLQGFWDMVYFQVRVPAAAPPHAAATTSVARP